jgi:hypothetical protein
MPFLPPWGWAEQLFGLRSGIRHGVLSILSWFSTILPKQNDDTQQQESFFINSLNTFIQRKLIKLDRNPRFWLGIILHKLSKYFYTKKTMIKLDRNPRFWLGMGTRRDHCVILVNGTSIF